MNSHGAVTAVIGNEMLGLRPDEFEVTAWQYNNGRDLTPGLANKECDMLGFMLVVEFNDGTFESAFGQSMTRVNGRLFVRAKDIPCGR